MHHYDKPDNLVELFETAVENYRDRLLFGTKNPQKQYEWVTYAEIGRRVDRLRGGLASLGVGRSDHVGIIASNRPEWAIAAFATYGRGARFVPMYEAELVSTWKHIIGQTGLKVLFVARDSIRDKIAAFAKEIPTLDHIICIEGQGENSLAELEAMGDSHPVASIRPDPGDIAAIIFTSGTTSTPKGVCLSHGNFTSNAQAGYHLFPGLVAETRFLSILPWAHAYAQTAELYNAFQFGGSIGLMESVATLAEDFQLVRPTYVMAVPRVFNTIYQGIWDQVNAKGGLARKLFVMSVEAYRRKRELDRLGQKSLANKLKLALADKVVFKKIRHKLGGRFEGSLTGSATMNAEIAQFFHDAGMPVFDCYGLTETSPAVTMNCPAAFKLGTVGKPVEKIRVVIDSSVVEPDAKDGEIIVHGRNVMLGYYNDPVSTAQVMTEDGGFRTGDRGRLDEDGYLIITGRIKEQYKLANGKYVFPAAIEEDITLLDHVSSAMVFGEGKPYNVCLVVPNVAALTRWAGEQGISVDEGEFHNHPRIRELILSEIEKSLTGKYGKYEIPKKILVLKEPFNLENGTLTQTMKLKRTTVTQIYREQLEKLYESGAEVLS